MYEGVKDSRAAPTNAPLHCTVLPVNLQEPLRRLPDHLVPYEGVVGVQPVLGSYRLLRPVLRCGIDSIGCCCYRSAHHRYNINLGMI